MTNCCYPNARSNLEINDICFVSAEMGADFNILEYADPELEALAGEKTNILDLELEEETLKKEKENARPVLPAQVQQQPRPPVQHQQQQQQQMVPQMEIKKEPISTNAAVVTQHQQQAVVPNSPHPPPLAIPQNTVHQVAPSSAPLLQQIHQHMIQQVRNVSTS